MTVRHSAEDRPEPSSTSELDAEVGGEPVCWLDRVCPGCGLLTGDGPTTTCPRCGETMPGH